MKKEIHSQGISNKTHCDVPRKNVLVLVCIHLALQYVYVLIWVAEPVRCM